MNTLSASAGNRVFKKAGRQHWCAEREGQRNTALPGKGPPTARYISFRAVTEGNEFEWADLVTVLERQAHGPSMKINFLAMLVAKHPFEGHTVLLATPLYVGMEE